MSPRATTVDGVPAGRPLRGQPASPDEAIAEIKSECPHA